MAWTVLMMPAAGRGDLLVGRAGHPHLELVGPVAGEGQVGVALHQAGHDHPSVGVHRLAAPAPGGPLPAARSLCPPTLCARRARPPLRPGSLPESSARPSAAPPPGAGEHLPRVR